ncbi:MAG TPA: nucleotidyltransferase [Actinomycetota bacterium]|nr:nucleotidyltransferase [Actinomycetota bacterium]
MTDPEDLRGDPLHDREVAAVLHESIPILESNDIPYVVIGGIATSKWGKPAAVKDLDYFVTKEDAERALKLLGSAGYKTEMTFPDWLYKAFKGPVMIDLIFAVKKKLHLDDEIVARAVEHELFGQKLKVVGPEDLVISLAVADSPDTPYWDNALSVLANTTQLDWEYLVRRADAAPQRMLGLLLYARSDGSPVPTAPMNELWDKVKNIDLASKGTPEILRSA